MDHPKIKRGFVRFKPDEGVYALIDLAADGATFDPTHPALVFSESHKGCGLVVLNTSKLQVGDHVRIQVGNLPVLKAEVRWRQPLDEDALKLGLMFID